MNTDTQNHDPVSNFMKAIAEHELEREAAIKEGLPALQRLAKIAQRDTGQAVTVRRFLLGLYNGHRWPFDLTNLRSIDKDLFDDCLAVLTLDARATIKEVHQYFTNGSALFETWAKEMSREH